MRLFLGFGSRAGRDETWTGKDETRTGRDGDETTATAFVPTRNKGEKTRTRILKADDGEAEDGAKEDPAAIANVCLTFN